VVVSSSNKPFAVDLTAAISISRHAWSRGGFLFHAFPFFGLARVLMRFDHVARDETEQARALRVVQEELKRLDWTKAELKRRRKGDEAKVALAQGLREETAVSLRWIAENLYMRTWTHVSNRLYHCR
jgi:hypothetical protein